MSHIDIQNELGAADDARDDAIQAYNNLVGELANYSVPLLDANGAPLTDDAGVAIADADGLPLEEGPHGQILTPAGAAAIRGGQPMWLVNSDRVVKHAGLVATNTAKALANLWLLPGAIAGQVAGPGGQGG